MENVSEWKGSTRTAAMVAQEIAQRWGSEEVKNYDPKGNCFTLKKWNQLGYKVKAGEKAIRSVTWIREDEADEKSHAYPKTVCLFYVRQVVRRDGAPTAQCGKTIAEAFGLDKVPGVLVVDPQPVATQQSLNLEVLA